MNHVFGDFKNLHEVYDYINNGKAYFSIPKCVFSAILDKIEIAMDYEKMMGDWKQSGTVQFKCDDGECVVEVVYAKGSEKKKVVISQ